MEFNNYNHFKNYCLKIASNRGKILDERQIDTFNVFEKVVNLLDELSNGNIITIQKSVYDQITSWFKIDEIDKALSTMSYIIGRIYKFYNKEFSFHYVVTALNSMLGLDVSYTEEFIVSKSFDNIFYPDRFRAIIVEDDTLKVYTLPKINLEYKDRYGIYFIYDLKGELSYIGKSTGSVLGRSFQSANERELLDFSKIEYRFTRSKSDVAVYEAYYISKFKPRCNTDMVMDDELSISLPELDVEYEIKRQLDKDFVMRDFKYHHERLVLADEFWANDKENMMLCTDSNLSKIESKGILDKGKMYMKVYEECLQEAKEQGVYTLKELKMGIEIDLRRSQN